MPSSLAIKGLLADLQTISDTAQTGVLSKRDIIIEPGETRPAAVLFVDVVGFTGLSRRLSSEALSKVIDRMFRIFELTVRAHGGYCDKVMGDGALYVFAGHPNYPPVCEAALLAALKLADRMRQVNASLAEVGLELAIRQGVAFGDVTRQAVGHAQAQLTVMGETVNIAQRLEAAAVPGTIQTTIRVVEKAGDAFIREPLGQLSIRGIGQVTAYNIAGIRQLPAHLRGAFLQLTPLIGREVLLRHALGQLESWRGMPDPETHQDSSRTVMPQAGRNHLMLITGVPAVGKSRFAYELVSRLEQEQPVAHATGQCTENLSLASFTAELAAVAGITTANLAERWEALCTNAARVVSEEYAQHARRWLPVLAYLLGCGGAEANEISSADPQSFALSCEMVLRTCCELAAHEGKQVVLVIEDLQWLGELRELVAGLMERSCLPAPLAVIGTARPEYLHRQDSLNEDQCCILQLRALNRDEGDAIIDALLPGLQLPVQLADNLHRRAAGIPYFYEDFVRMLVRRGLVEQHNSRWNLAAAVDELDIPEDLRALMLSRLDQLREEPRELLRRASALGNSFTLSLLCAVEHRLGFEYSGHPDSELRELVAEDILQTDNGERYYFKQSLLHEAAYGSLLQYNRILLHRITAEILEQQYTPGAAGQPELLAQLVHHLRAGNQPRQAHERACELLHLKASMLSLEDWDILFQQAIELSGGEPLPAGSRIRDAAAEGTASAEALARDASQLPESAGLHVALAEKHWRRGDLTPALAAAEKAVLLARSASQQSWEAKAWHLLANLHTDQGRMADALDCYEKALALHRQTGDLSGESNTLNGLGILHKSHGRLQQAGSYFNASLALRQRLGDRRGIATCLANLGLLSKTLGLMEEARSYIEQALAIFRELHDRINEGTQLNNLGNLVSDQGRMQEAMGYYEQSIAIRRLLGDRHGEVVTLVNLGSLYQFQGNPEIAQECFEQALEICRLLGDRYGIALCLNSLGCIAGDSGNIRQAGDYHVAVLESARELKEPRLEASSLIYYSRVLAWDGQLAEAKAGLDQCSSILNELHDILLLCLMHCSWVYFHLAAAGHLPKQIKRAADAMHTIDPDYPPLKALTLSRHALATAIGLAKSIGASATSEPGQEIAKARAEINRFSASRGIYLELEDLP